MKISTTSEDLSIMFNSARRTSIRIERHRIHAPHMQAMPSLMEFIGM